MIRLARLCIAALLLLGASAQAVELDLDAHRGKVVYVDIWASWCPPCRAAFPWMQAMHREFADQGLVILAVNTADNPADAARFLDANPVDFPIIIDLFGDIAGRLGAVGMPYSVIFDRRGQLVSRHPGFNPQNTDALRAEIEDLLAQGAD